MKNIAGGGKADMQAEALQRLRGGLSFFPLPGVRQSGRGQAAGDEGVVELFCALIALSDEQPADGVADPWPKAGPVGFVIARVLFEERGVGELLKEAGRRTKRKGAGGAGRRVGCKVARLRMMVMIIVSPFAD